MELADEDIVDAMQHIPATSTSRRGISRVYHLAHRHATERLLGGLRAEGLMRPVPAALRPA